MTKRSRKKNPNRKHKRNIAKQVIRASRQLKRDLTTETARFNYQWNFVPRIRNSLRKYINPNEEILNQRPIEEIQLDIEITLKELISRCTPTSNHRIGQTIVGIQQILGVNGLMLNDNHIFVHQEQAKQNQYIDLLSATYFALGSIKWKFIKANTEGIIPPFLVRIFTHGINSLQGILYNEGANRRPGPSPNTTDEELQFNDHLRDWNDPRE